MTPEHHTLIAKKACTRCSTQKRRCDRVIPGCGLCRRLHQTCKYELSRMPSSTASPSPNTRSELFPNSVAVTPSRLRAGLLHKLELLTPDDILAAYCRSIEPWFPFIAIARLQGRLPMIWDEATLDVAFFCLSIALFTTVPPSDAEDENDPSEFRSLYFYVKSSQASLDGLGLNSTLFVLSRVLITLFEVSHGFYPAAYISIGAAVRAADALDIYPHENASSSHLADDRDQREDREERLLIWGDILVLDKYITVDSVPHPSQTHGRGHLIYENSKPTTCPSHQLRQSRSEQFSRVSLFEASHLLDNIYTVLNSTTTEHAYKVQELLLIVQATMNLQAIVQEHIGDANHIYSAALGLCNTALLLACENGSKEPLIAGVAESCSTVATASLLTLLSNITSTLEPFVLDPTSVEFDRLPPFVLLLVYRAAGIVTKRLLLTDGDLNEGLRQLRILRGALGIFGKRWLACERYLRFLNEDTTPRILKALEQG